MPRPYDQEAYGLREGGGVVRYDPERHHRQSVRLDGYDYRNAGVYFVTVCSHQRECLFGAIVGGEMVANAFGEAVIACWHAISDHFADVTLDAFILMPNHLHGIVILPQSIDSVGARHASPSPASPSKSAVESSPPTGAPARSLGALIGSFKAAMTRRINQNRETPAPPVWQRNYYERIVRNERVLEVTRCYILLNPLHWPHDDDNPANYPLAPPP